MPTWRDLRRKATQAFFAAFLLFTALWPLTNYVSVWPGPKFLVWGMYSRGLGETNRDPILKLYLSGSPPIALPTERKRPLVRVFTPDGKPYFRYLLTYRAGDVIAKKLCHDYPQAAAVSLNLDTLQETTYPCAR